MANIFSDFWYRINKKLVPRNSKVTETSSDFIVELQNANEDKPADRETLVSFSIPKGTSFTPQDRQQVNAALETFKNVSSISSDQWTALKDTSKLENRITAAEENFDALKIGGRNLARNSAKFDIEPDKDNLYIGLYRTATIENKGDGFNEVKVTQPWMGVGVYANNLNLNVGDNLVFSATFKPSGNDLAPCFFVLCYDASGKRALEAEENIIYIDSSTVLDGSKVLPSVKDGDHKRISVQIKWTDKAKSFIDSGGSIELTLQSGPDLISDSGNSLSIYTPKLERGNKATDWTPAPEDKADVSALAKKADASALIRKADVTTIVPSAFIELSTTASQAYSVDSLIMVNGALRRVTNPITKGDVISDSNSAATTVSLELSRLSHQTTLSEHSNVPHGGLRLNINNNRTHQLYGTAIVRNDEWDSIWSNSVKCPGISDNNWYIKTNFKVWIPSKAYNVPCAGIAMSGISQYIIPENFNNAVYYVGSDGYIYLQIGSSKPTTTYLWFFWGRVAEEGIA